MVLSWNTRWQIEWWTWKQFLWIDTKQIRKEGTRERTAETEIHRESQRNKERKIERKVESKGRKREKRGKKEEREGKEERKRGREGNRKEEKAKVESFSFPLWNMRFCGRKELQMWWFVELDSCASLTNVLFSSYIKSEIFLLISLYCVDALWMPTRSLWAILAVPVLAICWDYLPTERLYLPTVIVRESISLFRSNIFFKSWRVMFSVHEYLQSQNFLANWSLYQKTMLRDVSLDSL